MVLECCRAARATVLITGDGDLLALAKAVTQVSGLRRLRILSPRAYLETRQKRSVRRRWAAPQVADRSVAIDRQTGGRGRRSAFIENAVRSYLTILPAGDRKDLGIINRLAKRLNEEAEDVLSYQAVPWDAANSIESATRLRDMSMPGPDSEIGAHSLDTV
jgi:hypothetical protein